MKRLSTLLFSVLLTSGAFAQAQETVSGPVTGARLAIRNNPGVSPLAIVDTTLLFSSRAQGQVCASDSLLTYYRLTNGGFATGTNASGFTEFGERFRFPGPFHVLSTSAALSLRTNTTDPVIHANVYSGALTRFGNIYYADTASRVESDGAAMSLLANNTYNEFTFGDTTTYMDSVIVTIRIPSGAGGDSLAIFATRPTCFSNTGQVDGFTLQRGQRGVRAINTRITNFTIDVAMMLLVEYDNATATLPNLSGATQLYPVPASQDVVVMLPNNLRGTSSWQLIGADGKTVRQGRFDGVRTTLERGTLTGVYSLQIQSTAGPIVKRVVFGD